MERLEHLKDPNLPKITLDSSLIAFGAWVSRA